MGFSRRNEQGISMAAWIAILNIARYNCDCGAWIVLPRSFVKDNPLNCRCGRRHFWVKFWARKKVRTEGP